jgi:O-antigen/teichoic acid export membrane protein
MVRSSLSNWIGLLVTGAINFVLTPILIHELGDFRYGIWILVFSVLTYYGLLDFGMYTTSLRFVAKAHGEGDRQTLNELLVNSLAIASALAVLAILITGAGVWLIPHFFGLSGETRQLFRWVLSLLGVSIAITSLSQLLGNYLCGLHRFDLFNFAKIVTSILRTALMLLALFRGYGLIGLAGATLIAAVISVPLYWFLIRRADPLLTVEKSSATWATVRELMGFGFFSFLATLGNYARFYLDSVVIARVLKFDLITHFSIAAQLVEYFRMIMQGVGAPLITTFSKLVGKQCPREVLQGVLIQTTKFTSLLSFFAVSLLVLDGRVFLKLWVGDRFLSSYHLLVILALAYAIMLAQIPSNSLLYALNKHRALAAWTLAEGFANLGLSIYLARSYGLVGVALGTAIPMLVTSIFVQPWYALRQINLPLGVYLWRALARPAAIWVLFLAFCRLAGLVWEAVNLPTLLLAVAWQTALFGFLAYWAGVSSPERKDLQERGKRFATRLRLYRAA